MKILNFYFVENKLFKKDNKIINIFYLKARLSEWLKKFTQRREERLFFQVVLL